MANFTFNGIIYEQAESGYCYKFNSDKRVRIGKAEFEKAQADKAEADAKAEAEKKAPKKSKKAKKSAAFTASIALADDKIADVSLTANQLAFLKALPKDNFFEAGAESTIWIDIFCDTLADIMNAMVVGALVSTLREKDLIYVAEGRPNGGKKCKYFGFTDLGKAILKELGLV